MIRALQVHCEFNPQSSGVARHVDGLAHAMGSSGAVAVTCFSSQPPLPLPGRAYPVTSGTPLALARAIAACDLVHAHGSRTFVSALALRLARAFGKPSVFTPHCYYDGGSPLRQACKAAWDLMVERRSVKLADSVILLHEGWVEDLRRRGLHPRHTAVIPNCVDAEVLGRRMAAAEPRRLSGAPALLALGRVDAVKRIDDAIRALGFPELAQAELHVVGKGPDEQRLAALVRELGLEARVHFHGWQADDASAAMMRGCDAMILASEREGLPSVMLEALLAGVPMVHSDIPGNMAVARAAGWTWHYPLGDCAALARCARAAAGSGVPDETRDAVARAFSWQSRADDVARLYRTLIEARQR